MPIECMPIEYIPLKAKKTSPASIAPQSIAPSNIAPRINPLGKPLEAKTVTENESQYQGGGGWTKCGCCRIYT